LQAIRCSGKSNGVGCRILLMSAADIKFLHMPQVSVRRKCE